MELYNVQRFNSQAVPRPPSPPLSEDDVSFEHHTSCDILSFRFSRFLMVIDFVTLLT